MRAGLTELQFSFAAQVSDAGRRELGACASRRVKARKILLSRGDPVEGAFLVTSGCLRVYYVTREGREATLYRIESGGACVLSITASFNREPYPAWVESCDGGATFVVVPTDSFRRLIADEPPFRDFIFGALSGRVFELMQALEEAGSLRMEQRVASFLLRRVGVDRTVRASQAAIAAELGTAREVVFRALRSLSAQKLIETSRARITLVDTVGLRRCAGSR
jgi:CRP/FNR family transcriptional regulator